MFDKNYAKNYDLLNKRKDYKKEIKFIYDWADHPLKVLDIGCGTANYWRHFPKTVDLVGVEPSQEMIAQSRYKDRIYCGTAEGLKWLDFIPFDCVTALFQVINYIPTHDWWKYLPIRKGSYFIFDIWDKNKVRRDGFKITTTKVGKVTRTISPMFYDTKRVELGVETNGDVEIHSMFLHSFADIEKFCGYDFEIADIKHASRWQSWYKCVKK